MQVGRTDFTPAEGLFPVSLDYSEKIFLRDQMAMSALQGMLASGPVANACNVCVTAYLFADEMLKAREQ